WLGDSFDRDHLQIRGARAQALGSFVCRRRVEPLGGIEALKLEHHKPLWLPVPFEDAELSASDQKPSVASGDRIRRSLLVALVLLGVVDVGLDDDVRGHGCHLPSSTYYKRTVGLLPSGRP